MSNRIPSSRPRLTYIHSGCWWGEGKKICVRYPKAIHGCHAAGCVHIIYNNNMWIHFRLHYCSVFVLNILRTAHERCQIPFKLNQTHAKHSVPFSDADRLLCERFTRNPRFRPWRTNFVKFQFKTIVQYCISHRTARKPAGLLYSNAFYTVNYRAIKYYVVILLYFNKITSNGIFELFLWKILTLSWFE